MGNNALARNLGFSHRRNKDFQAVAPSPFKDEASQAEKIEITPGKKRKVAEVERIDDGQVKDGKSSPLNFFRELKNGQLIVNLFSELPSRGSSSGLSRNRGKIAAR